MDNPLKIYLQDSAFAHCIFSNNPMPPKQLLIKLNGYEMIVLLEDIVVWTDMIYLTHLYRPGKNIAWLVEAWDHIPHLYEFVIKNYR